MTDNDTDLFSHSPGGQSQRSRCGQGCTGSELRGLRAVPGLWLITLTPAWSPRAFLEVGVSSSVSCEGAAVEGRAPQTAHDDLTPKVVITSAKTLFPKKVTSQALGQHRCLDSSAHDTILAQVRAQGTWLGSGF